jgi:hypothetical protein
MGALVRLTVVFLREFGSNLNFSSCTQLEGVCKIPVPSFITRELALGFEGDPVPRHCTLTCCEALTIYIQDYNQVTLSRYAQKFHSIQVVYTF